MDNLTHSLAGALLGQMGLKRKTGLAMPTLIIAANLPDIDVIATLLQGHQHLALRRGITHGPLAMILLPLLLWAVMLWFDRWQTRRHRRPAQRLPLHKGWLLVLAYIGCLSHPLFDWFNSYGVRLLEPFSSQWFYGDTIFIIDIWLWAALITGVWVSLRRERRGIASWRAPAVLSVLAICAYILANGAITERAERLTMQAVQRQQHIVPTQLVANPVPVQFWKREMLWRNAQYFGHGEYRVPSVVVIDAQVLKHRMNDEGIVKVLSAHADARRYLFWSRMPVAEITGEAAQRSLLLSDQRFGNQWVREQFVMAIPWPDAIP